MGGTPPIPLRLDAGFHDNRSSADFSLDDGRARQLGGQLFRAVFHGAVRERFLTSLAVIEGRSGRGLRIRLKMRAQEVGDLCFLPWELLYRAETRDFLSRDVRTPVVRHVDVQRPMVSMEPTGTLRVLGLFSSPTDRQPLDLESERQCLDRILGQHENVQWNGVRGLTLAQLRSRVLQQPFDILHWVGHGSLDHRGRGCLIFEDASGYGRTVGGEVLAENLKGLGDLRLVVVNACDSARLEFASRQPFQAVASALLMAGVPAVVAMQKPVSDRAAIVFISAFYEMLSRGGSLEEAMAEGRMAVYNSVPESPEWWTPVLFLNAVHGRLLSFREPPSSVAESSPESASPESVTASSDPPEEACLEALDFERYDEAQKLLWSAEQGQGLDSDGLFYLALSRLAGRRLRSQTAATIRRIEKDLRRASHRCRGREPAHLWLFSALIKHDFYHLNGLRVPPPAVEEILAEAKNAPRVDRPLRYLADHARTSENAVRRLLRRWLAELDC